MRALYLAAALSLAALPAGAYANGTARVQQADGDTRTYQNVRIAIADKQMTITSADGVGTIVIERAGCVAVDKLVRCHPYEASLRQRGQNVPIVIKEGTAWFNPSGEAQQLPMSSQMIPAKGVVMSMSSQKGTFLSLTGVVDSVKR